MRPPLPHAIRRPALALAACTLLLAPGLADAFQDGKVAIETVEYGGWKNNLRLSNGDAELILTLDVGPRILSYRLNDGKNVFKEYADQLGKSGEDTWQIRGGHRLWVSPEDLTRTYAPDNAPLRHQVLGDGLVRVVGPADRFGIEKEMDVKLDPTGSGVTVIHRIRNAGQDPTRLAPWALTVMNPGGIEIIPMPPIKAHPGGAADAKSAEEFGPNRALILWPYFEFSDPRWTFGDRYITLKHAERGPTKLGLSHTMTWVAYLNGGTLFVKRIPFDAGKTYPDRGANYETFTNEDMVEMESLGPLVDLPPGGVTEHIEIWTLRGGLGDAATEDEIEKVVEPAIRGR